MLSVINYADIRAVDFPNRSAEFIGRFSRPAYTELHFQCEQYVKRTSCLPLSILVVVESSCPAYTVIHAGPAADAAVFLNRGIIDTGLHEMVPQYSELIDFAIEHYGMRPFWSSVYKLEKRIWSTPTN